DQHVAGRWAEAGVAPAPAADDAEFLRRVYLDLAGRIPSVAEARKFLDDKRPDKRLRLIEELLTGPRYVVHFTNVWRSLMIPEGNTSIQVRFAVPTFEAWLKKQLVKNAGYDEMVRELLTVSVNAQDGRVVFAPGVQQGEATPIGFYLAKEMKPENLGAATA